MHMSSRAIAATAAAVASGFAGASHAEAAVPERACLYQYVVTNGRANNVATYINPRGSARGPSIHPRDVFFVNFGSHGKTPDHIGQRQRIDTPAGFHGWVTFPRDYLVRVATSPCLNAA